MHSHLDGSYVGTVAIVGSSGAGKSTTARALARVSDAVVIEIGKYVVADSLHCDLCSSPLAHADHVFRGGEHERFVGLAWHDASLVAGPRVIVGPRSPLELEFLLSRGVLLTVGLTADAPTRSIRRLSRGSGDPNYLHHLQWRDCVENSWGLPATITRCDQVFNSAETPEVLALRIASKWLEKLTS